MKNILKLKSAAFVGAILLSVTAGAWSKDGKLTEITKPYLGTYECERLYVGDDDKIEEFEYVRLELCKDGELKLIYKQPKNRPEQVSMEYRYDEQTKTLYVKGKLGVWRLDKSFSLNNGELTGEMRLGNKNVVVKFKR